MMSDARRLEARDFASVLPAVSEQTQAATRSLAQAVADTERVAIAAALEAAHGNKSLAAQTLGVSRATLYEKMAQLGLQPREHRVSG
jgi:DNA-binding NtrC family response regulator